MGEREVKIHGIGGGYLKIHDDGGGAAGLGTALVEMWRGEQTASMRVCIDPRKMAAERDALTERNTSLRATIAKAEGELPGGVGLDGLGAYMEELREQRDMAATTSLDCQAEVARLKEQLGTDRNHWATEEHERLRVERDTAIGNNERLMSSLRLANDGLGEARDALAAGLRRESAGQRTANDGVRLAMERAVRMFDRNDKVFNAAGFAVALAGLSDTKGAIDGKIVRAILTGRPDVEVLTGGAHYRLVEAKP